MKKLTNERKFENIRNWQYKQRALNEKLGSLTKINQAYKNIANFVVEFLAMIKRVNF